MANYVPSIDYSSRDYASIRADLIGNIQNFAPQWISRDPSDLGIVLLELYAYMGDIMSFYIDRSANETFLETATQRESVLAMARLFGYPVSQGSPSLVTLTFTNDHPTKDIVVQPGLQVSTASLMNAGVSPVTFETANTTNETVSAGGGTKTIQAYEGTTITGEVLVNLFNGLPSQVFRLVEPNVHIESIKIYVNSVQYSRVDNLIEATGTSAVYSTQTDSQGYTYIEFGDNVGGKIPPLNSSITATYRVISGTAGNVVANSINYILTPYSFSDTTDGSGLSVTNGLSAVGGADPESTSSIRYNIPKSLKSINRAVTLDDYASLALQVNGVGKTKAQADVFSSVNLYMGLSGTSGLDSLGNPTTAWNSKKAEVETYIANKIAPGITVTVAEPTMVPVILEVTVNVDNTYMQNSVVSAVTSTLSTLLSYEDVNFGQTISKQQVYTQVALVQGVKNSNITLLHRQGSTPDVVDVVCLADEIPYAYSIVINPVGGIV